MQDMLAKIDIYKEKHCAKGNASKNERHHGESERFSSLQNGGGEKNRSERNESRNTIHTVRVG
jgi:hypothetical protein